MMIKPEIYNDVIYNISQAALNKITESIVSVSFDIKNEIDIRIIVYNLEDSNKLDNKILALFEKELKDKLSKYLVNVEFRKISKLQFQNYDYETLNYVSFLRDQDDC